MATAGAGCVRVDGTGGLSAGGTGSSSGGADAATASQGPGPTSPTGPPDGTFDVGHATDTDGPPPICEVGPDGDAPAPCEQTAPPESFDPVLKWEWDGPDLGSVSTPLVANLTDDNGDGVVDLCDVPDVVVATEDRLVVLDGGSGALITSIPQILRAHTPAIGDIDGDGVAEIVVQDDVGGVLDSRLAAYEADGTKIWQASDKIQWGQAIAMADLDNDGDVEIMIERLVYDHTGALIASTTKPVIDFGGSVGPQAPVAADLDGDGDLEVVYGPGALHHDGTELFWNDDVLGTADVGDLDGDGEPEVLVIHREGFSIVEHDGTLKLGPVNPTGDTDWRRPSAILDVDGDGWTEFVVSSLENYSLFEGDGALVWSSPVDDASGLASGTAYDFLGDGRAEALYGDESHFWAFDGSDGSVAMSTLRNSRTILEYPTVADVDNDGFAEIVVVSETVEGYAQNGPIADVQVFEASTEASNEGWVGSRRIWNQHTYHVTNVREDGTIPQFEPPHWQLLNTFRTQAQITRDGVVCRPEG